MNYVFEPPPRISIPVIGTEAQYPVRRIYCVGRNYNDHVVEMGGVPGREAPFFFQKPADAILLDGVFQYPLASKDVHHEIELVVALKSGGVNIPFGQAESHIFGYAVGIDMTRRDLQAAAKKAGRPWEMAKAFDQSAPMSAISAAAGGPLPAGTSMTLSINGAEQQVAEISDMIWSVPEIIAELSKLFELKAGDIIFTGTPSGVGPVQPGDQLHASISGIGEINLRIAA